MIWYRDRKRNKLYLVKKSWKKVNDIRYGLFLFYFKLLHGIPSILYSWNGKEGYYVKRTVIIEKNRRS